MQGFFLISFTMPALRLPGAKKVTFINGIFNFFREIYTIIKIFYGHGDKTSLFERFEI